MGDYPHAVLVIVSDYTDRVKQQLGRVRVPDRDEFLREIQSHVLEAYTQEPGTDEIARILSVLRRFGDPAEVVADRLPEAMVRRKVPLHLVAGVLIALFGIPLGFGGAAVVGGVLVALAGIVISYYALAGLTTLSGLLLMMLGLIRAYQPEFWNRLIDAGVIEMNAEFARVIAPLSAQTQGFFLIIVGLLFTAAGVSLLWLGKYLVRGYRFLGSLVFDRVRKIGGKLRLKTRLQEGRIWFNSEASASR